MYERGYVKLQVNIAHCTHLCPGSLVDEGGIWVETSLRANDDGPSSWVRRAF